MTPAKCVAAAPEASLRLVGHPVRPRPCQSPPPTATGGPPSKAVRVLVEPPWLSRSQVLGYSTSPRPCRPPGGPSPPAGWWSVSKMGWRLLSLDSAVVVLVEGPSRGLPEGPLQPVYSRRRPTKTPRRSGGSARVRLTCLLPPAETRPPSANDWRPWWVRAGICGGGGPERAPLRGEWGAVRRGPAGGGRGASWRGSTWRVGISSSL